MPNENLYIHETIRISVRHRKDHLNHFCGWGARPRELFVYHWVPHAQGWA
ncbi:MAG: hypothetical protein JRG86_06145 [Deltaproteobacteria bacterium]|jgi:hypothetical protein|nr:hypothetical protein [Deltaproteobacteria bacterium]MBW2499580.1 hypothetical protein [Deltaproteobacteria bacterium]